jgi:hypothetical protein
MWVKKSRDADLFMSGGQNAWTGAAVNTTRTHNEEETMSRRKYYIGPLVLVAIAATAALAAGKSPGGESTPRLSNGELSALSRAPAAEDVLPANVLQLPIAQDFARPLVARRLATEGGRRIYAVRGRQKTTCLVVIESSDDATTVNCAGVAQESGAVWQGTPQNDGTVDVVGIVGDGVAYARAGDSRAQVENNVFILKGKVNDEVVLGTAAGLEAKLDLGTQWSPP